MTAKKILAKYSDKNVHETVDESGHDYITILGAGCADGTRLPLFVVYKGRICGVGGCKVDQLAVCILSWTVDGWKQQFCTVV